MTAKDDKLSSAAQSAQRPLTLSQPEAAALRLGDNPTEAKPARVREPHPTAAGIPAIINTAKFGLRAMGPLKAAQAFLMVNKASGYDCQSCAWPSPDKRKVFEFCENGAKAISDELTHRTIGPEFFAQHSVESLRAQSDFWLNAQGRITEPMVLRAGATHYAPIAWDEAFELIAANLKALADPNEAVFYTSGKTCNEAAFLFQLFARQFGTNNLPDCSNMCHESSGTALTSTIGIGKGTAKLEDFERCDTILVLGNNPGTNHPRMLTSLEEAKRNGATIVAINPMPETGLMRVINPNPQDYKNPLKLPLALLGSGTALADLHVPVRVNGDAALLQGVMKSLLEREATAPGTVVDRAFVAEHTSGFEAFAAAVSATPWSDICDRSGIEQAMIEQVAEIVAQAKRMIICWCLGLTQHVNGVENVEQLINLLLMGGHIGREGTGPCCVRGHSNVQGDRTMGVYEQPSAAFLDAMDREFGFKSPRAHGLDLVKSLRAMHDGRVKVFFAISGNVLSAAPDTHYTARAFANCELVTYVSTKLHRNHLVTGKQALILPCLGRAEREFQGGKLQVSSAEDSMGIVNPTRGQFDPISSHLLSDVEILVRLGRRTFGPGSTVDWEALLDQDRVRDRIERVIPGFAPFNARLHEGPFYLPNGARERQFHTTDGKAHFTVCGLPDHALGAKELLLTTVRSHDQFNSTIYGLNDRYRGIYGGRRVILLNAADIAELGLASGDWVDITSHFEGEQR
ncbi:MAG TPA: FdhF/YdeP family oxidoreductase, partial [Polyangiaceae bacterium]|nr:FdhF/YdeP family oxidoreductase [Polyangiaceae bacterium]